MLLEPGGESRSPYGAGIGGQAEVETSHHLLIPPGRPRRSGKSIDLRTELRRERRSGREPERKRGYARGGWPPLRERDWESAGSTAPAASRVPPWNAGG